ncbi:MAG: MBL fold metallo-hydrolase [Lachnospiraceae bacterium]|nr:MBL fold metallo-hydrolase [Lachnospiraceae bacterium]
MVLEFVGADREVTGSCHYLRFGDKHILVDCGMEQGPDLYVNQEILVPPADIDYVFVTHAHIDHSGLLPLLYSHGFRGEVYATKATCDLCNIMLRDSAHIQEFEAEWKNRKAKRSGKAEVEPMYTTNDAIGVLEHFLPCDYDSKMNICEGLEVRFVDAGHLLGSSSIEMWVNEDGKETKIVFSGDIGHGNRPLIKDPSFIEDADYVLIESTYGDRLHETPPDYALLLADIIRDTFKRGGNLVIPAFAVGRTQEMLYHIRRIKTEDMLPEFPNFPVYIDSPLAVEATNIFNENIADCFNYDTMELVKSGINPIKFDGLHVAVSSDESKLINMIDAPKVIISASGMCEAGRIRHHLKHNLWRADSTILFVGYQVPGTLGFNLLNGATSVKLFGEEIDVKAKIVKCPGISAHADKDHLTDWLRHFKNPPKKVFIVHGEEETSLSFAEHVKEELGFDTYVPYSGDVYDLDQNTCIKEGSREHAISKRDKTKSAGAIRATGVYARLLQAGNRLLHVIQKSQGMANKDLAKFADQITALADKWDK